MGSGARSRYIRFGDRFEKTGFPVAWYSVQAHGSNVPSEYPVKGLFMKELCLIFSHRERNARLIHRRYFLVCAIEHNGII